MKKHILFPLILLIFFSVPQPGWSQSEEGASRYLWRMINQARVHPMETIQALGIDEGAARQSLGSDQWIIDEGLPPLAWNDKLALAGLEHGKDMIARLYYSSDGPDGNTVEDRIRATGYHPVSTGELLGALVFPGFIDPIEAAKIVFQNWVRDEFNPGRQGERHIFNAVFKEMGAGIIGAVLNLGGGIPPNAFVAVADFAEPEEIRNYQLGNVYRDLNGNGAMEPEEGVAGVTVVVRGIGSSNSSQVIAGPLGGYQLELPEWQLVLIDVVGPRGPLMTGFLAAGGGDQSRLIDLQLP